MNLNDLFGSSLGAKKKTNVKDDEKNAIMADQALTYVYRYFWLVNLIAVVSVLLSAYLFFIKPKYFNITSNAEVIKAASDYLDQLEYYKQLLELKKIYNAINLADKNKINNIVDVVNDKNELFREFQYIVRSNGMTTVSIEPVEMDDNFVPPTLSPNNLGGSLISTRRVIKTSIKLADVEYQNLISMLKVLELNQRIMDVNKISYDPAKRTAELEVFTYKQR